MKGVLPATLAGASVAAFILAVSTRLEPAVRRLRDRASRGPGEVAGTQMLLTFPLRNPFLRRAARLDRLELLLGTSGSSTSLFDLLRIKALVAVSLTVGLSAANPELLPFALIAGAGAFAVPDIVVARMVRKRRRRTDAEIPQFLDLLAAASSSGLSGPAAIHRATAGLRGPLADELMAATSAVDAGARWRDELKELATRLQLPDLAAAVAVVSRSERLGSSLAVNLRELASEVRESRRARAAELARTAPVKMLFPLVFMVLPAFLLLTVVPVLIATIRSLD